MGNELYSRTHEGECCGLDMVGVAIQSIIDDSSMIYEDLLYQLPEKQSQVLLAIGKEGKAEKLTSGKFAYKYGLVSPNLVKSAVPALIDKGLLTMDKGVYQLYDKFFHLWLLQHA